METDNRRGALAGAGDIDWAIPEEAGGPSGGEVEPSGNGGAPRPQ